MKVFRDLTIHLTGTTIAAFVACLDRHASGTWPRDIAQEKRLQALSLGQRQQFCFTCQHPPELSPASLWLVAQAADRLVASNIISSRKDELIYDEYNALLVDFHDRVAQPAAAECGATVAMTADQVTLQDLLPPDAANLLQRFSASANRTTGLIHPADLARWLDFIAEVHRRSCALSPDLLRRWLIEEQHWSPDLAARLVEEYEFGRELLTAYDSKAG